MSKEQSNFLTTLESPPYYPDDNVSFNPVEESSSSFYNAFSKHEALQSTKGFGDCMKSLDNNSRALFAANIERTRDLRQLQKISHQSKGRSIKAAVHKFLHDINQESELSVETETKIMEYIKILDVRIHKRGKREGKGPEKGTHC